jgi:hypothetical protein
VTVEEAIRQEFPDFIWNRLRAHTVESFEIDGQHTFGRNLIEKVSGRYEDGMLVICILLSVGSETAAVAYLEYPPNETMFAQSTKKVISAMWEANGVFDGSTVTGA